MEFDLKICKNKNTVQTGHRLKFFFQNSHAQKNIFLLLLTVQAFFLSFLALPITFVSADQGFPTSLSFVGFIENHWRVFVVQPGRSELKMIETQSEPRTPVYSAARDALAYIGTDGALWLKNLNNEKETVLLNPSGRDTLTQPTFNEKGSKLYISKLKDGKSQETQVLVVDVQTGSTEVVIRQRSAQLDSHINFPFLYYSNIHCVNDCGKVIYEVWRKNLVSGESEQLTLFNAISNQPVVDPAGNFLYFSSNKNDNFHIWRLDLESRESKKLTQGNVADVDPSLDQTGVLYFIRYRQQSANIIQRSPAGKEQIISLPKGVTDIRDLEIGR